MLNRFNTRLCSSSLVGKLFSLAGFIHSPIPFGNNPLLNKRWLVFSKALLVLSVLGKSWQLSFVEMSSLGMFVRDMTNRQALIVEMSQHSHPVHHINYGGKCDDSTGPNRSGEDQVDLLCVSGSSLRP
ncbi:hypothetical protein J437_LFUL018702 [Ladona fulva]|uniref:Uncharacterized protein n=1 Tax=Ladona fulva TaxID=123851 RepID=A0A8K0KRC3_LADFU|nr:hypothetical protein J437_LFUL018702 [Ladona fulva]